MDNDTPKTEPENESHEGVLSVLADIELDLEDMEVNAAKLAAKLTPENLRLLRDAIDKQLGE